ncbi:hypothetical protein BR93DRAFT_218064 [Coniochaeta sp. PMI_546]|nr:hypothetical protein BR93DRAFT_218064 [Coniochaeta sp. PMI_546]
MVQSRLSGFLLGAFLCLNTVIAASCTLTVIAKAGDTCASLSGANALTVTQFIQLNPAISTCSLVPGTPYCVSDDPAAVPTTPRTTTIPVSTTSRPAAGPTGTLVPSPDGSDGICGGEYTCLGSVYGDCCSANGYCGNTTDYCDEGCNSVFGRCGGGVPVDQPGTGASTTVTVTIIGGPSTCPAATRTVTATITVNQTVTRLQTVTQTVTTTASAPARPSPTLEGTDARCES